MKNLLFCRGNLLPPVQRRTSVNGGRMRYMDEYWSSLCGPLDPYPHWLCEILFSDLVHKQMTKWSTRAEHLSHSIPYHWAAGGMTNELYRCQLSTRHGMLQGLIGSIGCLTSSLGPSQFVWYTTEKGRGVTIHLECQTAVLDIWLAHAWLSIILHPSCHTLCAYVAHGSQAPLLSHGQQKWEVEPGNKASACTSVQHMNRCMAIEQSSLDRMKIEWVEWIGSRGETGLAGKTSLLTLCVHMHALHSWKGWPLSSVWEGHKKLTRSTYLRKVCVYYYYCIMHYYVPEI